MGSFGSCLVGSACQCLCSAFKCCGASSKVFSRIGYALFALVWIILSTLLLYFGHYITIGSLADYLGCTDSATKDSCIGLSSVYRMSFSLVVFHLILFLLCSCRNEVIAAINEGAWPLKFLAVLGFFALTFAIPNGFFKVYGYIAMGASCLFLIYEMILVIDMAYSWNSAWVGNFDSSNENSGTSKCWCIMLIIGTIAATGGAITVYVIMFIHHREGALNLVVLIIPIVAAVTYYTLTVTQFARGGSIFTCSLFFFFQSFISMSIIFSNPSVANEHTLIGQIVIGLVFLFFVIFYAGIRTEKPDGQESTDAKATSEKVTNLLAESAEETEALTSDDKQATPEITTKTMLFHLFMAFASFYYSMVLTNWGAPKINSGAVVITFSTKHLAYGMMLAAQLVGILFFIWSLIASRVCRSRDFGDG